MASPTLRADSAHNNPRPLEKQRNAPRDRRRNATEGPLCEPKYPDDLPDVYASIATGTCLEPVFSDGVSLVMDKNAEVQAGDFVVVWFKPGRGRPGELPRQVKRLAMAPPPWVTFPYEPNPNAELGSLMLLEMLNPPRQFWVKCEDVLVLHKVIGTAKQGANGMAQFNRSDPFGAEA